MFSKKLTLLVLALFPLVLSACGENWTKIRTSEMFPYGNQRTAGSTIAFVRASLMPERVLNLEPFHELEAPPVLEPEFKEIVTDGKAFHEERIQDQEKVSTELQEMFRDNQKK